MTSGFSNGDWSRLTYLSEAAIPSRSTNAMQTMRMCAAFAEAGAAVTLVHPSLHKPEPEGFTGDLDDFYGIHAPFERRVLQIPTARGGAGVQRAARALPYMTYLMRRLHPRRQSFACYTRSFQVAWLAVGARRVWGPQNVCRTLFVELHDEPPARGWPLLQTVDGVIVTTNALRERVLERLPGLEGRVWTEHAGVDLSFVHREMDRERARERIGHRLADGPLVVYAGRVKAGKGVDVLIEAADRIKGINAQVLVVGKVYEADYVARAPTNVAFKGFVAPSDVPDYLAAADIVVMPSTDELKYAPYTSPLKLFEYMATGNPVVASDLPVIREILRHGENALLYPPRDAAALAEALEWLWSEPVVRRRLADQAWRDVQRYAWSARASRILERLQRLPE